MTIEPKRRPRRACGSWARKRPRRLSRAVPTAPSPRSRRVGVAAPRLPTTCSPQPGSHCLPIGSPATPLGEGSGPMPLPHWTEPATGEVPMIADEPGDEEAWAAASNEPRFRSDAGDYGDSDFALGDDGLHDETTAMGALVDGPEVDDDEEFAAQVAARRAPPRRTRSKPPRARRGGGASAAGAQYPTIEDETDAPHVSATPRVTPSGDDLTTRVITG